MANEPDRQRTLIHVSSFRFGHHHHPAVYRTIVALAPWSRGIALCGPHPGYLDRGTERDERDLAAAHGVAFHRLKRPSTLPRPDVATEVAVALRRRYGRIDALIGHLGANGWRALNVARFLHIPILTVYHGADAEEELRMPEFEPAFRVLQQAPGAYHLTVSGNLAKKLVEFGMDERRVLVHHLGIPLSEYRPAPRNGPGGPVRIALVGRFLPVKGHAMAVDAFETFRQRYPDSTLHFFGSTGSEEDAITARVRDSGLEGAVCFRGTVPVEELKRELGRMDFVLQPSILTERDPVAEGLPNTVLEAMAMAVPVIATRHGGLPEAVIDGETGLLVDEHDAAGLSEAMLRLADDVGLRRSMGERARRRIERDFDVDRQAGRMLEIVGRMCDEFRDMDPAERQHALDRSCTLWRIKRFRVRKRFLTWRNRRRLERMWPGDGPYNRS